MAAKASIDRLGTNLIEMNEENARGGHLLAQPIEQPRRTFVPALPLIGHLRPEAMLPVVVQLQRIQAPPTRPRMPGQQAAIPTPSRGSFCAVVEGRDGRRERAIYSRDALSHMHYRM